MSQDTMDARQEAIDECAEKIKAIIKKRKPQWYENAMNGSDGQLEEVERGILNTCLRAIHRVKP